jgi:hypothetical protein
MKAQVLSGSMKQATFALVAWDKKVKVRRRELLTPSAGVRSRPTFSQKKRRDQKQNNRRKPPEPRVTRVRQ